MRPTRILAGLWLAVALCTTPARSADDAYAWSLRYMLVNGGSDTTLFAATQEIASYSRLRTHETHELLADIVAQIRDQNLPAQESALNIARILAAAPDAERYHTLMSSLKKFITAKGSTQLMSRYFREHPKAKGEQFVPGRVDLAALRKQYLDAAITARPTMAQAQALGNLPPAATMDELFATVGMPTHVLPRDTRAVQRVGGIDVRQIVFYYRGIGRISYELVRDTWRPQELVIDPLAFEALMPYRKDAATPGMPDDAALTMIQLLSNMPHSIRISAIAVHRLEAAPREYLDTAAELLIRTHAQAKDDATIDAYSWLCNVFAHHGGRRYARVLAKVARETSDPKLKRYASQKVEESAEQQPAYVPGSVSIEEQRTRYPSLYPGITLARGIN